MKYRVDVADSARSSIAAYAQYLAEDKQAPESAKAMLERISFREKILEKILHRLKIKYKV